MNIFYIIMTVLLFIGLVATIIILFAIWRAILGKSSVDFKLAVTMQSANKKMDSLAGSLDSNTTGSSELAKQLKEVARGIKSMTDKIE